MYLCGRALDPRPGLEGLAGVAQDWGEGRWTVQEAIERGVATPVISAALYARFVSQAEESVALKAIAALREQFGGHAVLPEDAAGEGDVAVQPTDEAATFARHPAPVTSCSSGLRATPPRTRSSRRSTSRPATPSPKL